nr:MAG TPA: hypothetical protein [Caudoviricetes sp.]
MVFCGFLLFFAGVGFNKTSTILKNVPKSCFSCFAPVVLSIYISHSGS